MHPHTHILKDARAAVSSKQQRMRSAKRCLRLEGIRLRQTVHALQPIEFVLTTQVFLVFDVGFWSPDHEYLLCKSAVFPVWHSLLKPQELPILVAHCTGDEARRDDEAGRVNCLNWNLERECFYTMYLSAFISFALMTAMLAVIAVGSRVLPKHFAAKSVINVLLGCSPSCTYNNLFLNLLFPRNLRSLCFARFAPGFQAA
eukprot:6186758-Pleurochrysis_carterae.AAC.5